MDDMYTVIETRIKVVKKDATGGRRIPKGPPMSVVAPWQGTALVLKEKVAEQCSIEPASAATFRLKTQCGFSPLPAGGRCRISLQPDGRSQICTKHEVHGSTQFIRACEYMWS